MFGLFKRSVQPDLSFIGVDMHSHLLPGLDDGLPDIKDTIAYMKQLHALGYEKFICTPHILSDVHPNTPETILPILENVRTAIKEEGLPVTVEAAAEYMIDHEFEELIKSGKQLLTFGKNFILIEMSYLAPSPNLNSVIFELKVRGLQPIVAHPERYNYYHHQFKQYEKLKDVGCWMQVNLLSLSGYYGSQVKKAAERLIEAGLIDLVGTDMHHANHLNATKAFASSKDLYKILKDVPLKNKMLL